MKIKQYLSVLATAIFCCACTLDIPYENQFSDPDAVATPEAARELLATAYNSLPNPEFDLSCLADDFETTYLISKNTSLANQYNWQPAALESLALTLWHGYYGVIASINALLERIPTVACATPEEEEALQIVESEAKVLKAACYFDLLRLFAPAYDEGGNQPGIVLKDRLEMELLARSPIDSCVTAIRNLLTASQQTVCQPEDCYWLGNSSAEYLLAELALYTGEYSEAARHAENLLDSYSDDVLSENSYAGLWSDGDCPERIFSLYTTQSFYTAINYDREKGDYLTVNRAIVTQFDPNDLRYQASIQWFRMPGQIIGDTTDVPNLGKYNRLNWEQTEIRYINKFRLSGAYLVLAEAYCRLGDSRAATVLNDYLRQRRATLTATSLSRDDLLKRILEERHKEFIGEGTRYFDLKRCRKDLLQNWCSTSSRNINANDYRWTFPIPKEEYLYNEFMEQNDGWTKIES